MNCNFQPHDGKYKCTDCGFIAANPALRNCPNKIENAHKDPSLFRKGVNFTKAVVKDAVGGFERCTQEEIDARLAICKDCPLFNKYSEEPLTGVCSHSSCGCSLSRDRIYMNKLSHKVQKCPLGKW